MLSRLEGELDWIDKEQRIRTPEEILGRPNQGTCVDLSLLFGGLCLHHQLSPVLVVLDGHAFAAVCLSQMAADKPMYGRAGEGALGEGDGLALPGSRKIWRACVVIGHAVVR